MGKWPPPDPARRRKPAAAASGPCPCRARYNPSFETGPIFGTLADHNQRGEG